jgi:hypothetical protein
MFHVPRPAFRYMRRRDRSISLEGLDAGPDSRTKEPAMADFILLPPRPVIGEEIARLIRPYLPAVRLTASDCIRFLEIVVEANRGRAFLVHRDDLPDGEEVATAIRDGFGADTGDRIVQISVSNRVGEPRVRVLEVGAIVVG